MGWAKLCKRKVAIVCDSDDEAPLVTVTSRNCKTCQEKTCFSEKRIEPPDDIETIHSDDSLENLERVPNVLRRDLDGLDGLVGPDFLGTPKAKRLPASKDPPSGKVRFLKLRTDTPEKLLAKQVSPGETTEPNGSKPESGSDLHPKSGKSERFVDKLSRSTRKDPPVAEALPPTASPLMSRIDNSRALSKPHARAARASQARRQSKFFSKLRVSTSAPAPVLDCDEVLASAAGKRLADAAVTLQRPGVALVIKKRWCDEIFEGSKIWEIRGSSLAKRGRICIAQSKSQMLVGEVEVVNCLKVGRKVDGKLVPWSDSPQDVQNFIGASENLPKHCVEDLSWVPYSKVFAWVLDKKLRYTEPQPYRHKKGCIQWVKLEPGEPKPRHSFALRRRSQLGAASRRAPTVQPVPVVSAVALRPATSNEPAWKLPANAPVKFLDDDPPQHREPIDVD